MINFSKVDFSNSVVKEYKVYGCKKPSDDCPSPQVYSMTIFTKNERYARDLFFEQLKNQYKIKSTNGEILKIREVEQVNDFVVRNYYVNVVVKTKTGYMNARKEVRQINRALAVSAIIKDLGSRHRVQLKDIRVSDIYEITDVSELTKSKVISYSDANVQFPVFIHEKNTNREFVPVDYKIFE